MAGSPPGAMRVSGRRSTTTWSCWIVSAAGVQDRDGAIPLLRASRRRFPFIALASADTAYAAARVTNATSIAIQIVR